MSSLEFGREFEINEKSTIPELIGLLISSFQRKEFKLVEGILIKREEELKTRLQKEQEERNLSENRHYYSELEIFEMKDDLKRLKNENLELKKELQKLQREKPEIGQKFRGYEERMTNLEKTMVNVFSVDVGIQTLSCDSLETDLQKEGSSNLDSKPTAENVTNRHEYAQASYGVQSPSNGPWFGNNSSRQEKKSCNDGTLKIRKDLPGGHSNAQIGLENARDTPKVDINGLKRKNQNDSSYAAASKSIKRTCDGPQFPNVVEIIESDDEVPRDEKLRVLNTCSSEVNSSKKGESGSSGCPTEDKSMRNVRSNPLDNLLPKRKRSLTDTDDNQMVKERCQRLQIDSRKLDFCSDDDSSDYGSTSNSDDDCTESLINKMIESLRQDCRKSQKRWNFATDMQLEFLTNYELCMNAVCALYRKEISTEKSINYTSSPINLDLFNAKSGKDLAEYLIDGDPEYKLKRTVSEVQQKDSTLLDRCKELALEYCETLFEIYHKNEDPFFPPKL